jgi:hypothetical protein
MFRVEKVPNRLTGARQNETRDFDKFTAGKRHITILLKKKKKGTGDGLL